MSDYYREQSYHSRKRLLRRLQYALLILFVAVAAGGALVAFDVYKSSTASDTPSASTKAVTSTIVAGSEIHNSPYFQFQTPEKWRAIANETRDGHYVYRQYNGPLVEQEFVVDVNRVAVDVLALVQTNRVQAVRVAETGSLQVEGDVSEHCSKLVPKGTQKTPQIIKINQVTFACNPDSTQFIVVVGVVGGTEGVGLTRVDGSKASYRMTYKNVTAIPNARDLDNMLQTFKSR